MKMYRPYEKVLRRVFQTGIWLHYKSYPHTIQFHAKLYRLQIDNQLPDCIFRTVLAPVPPPRSVSLENGTLEVFI
jgi:vacuolar protein sorting-associated protein 13A/C